MFELNILPSPKIFSDRKDFVKNIHKKTVKNSEQDNLILVTFFISNIYC